mmetsp:Transcript_24756/g.32330  ORF Transcript_24756/g.32330 Transcript_24756/m.32330 type:complete len:320 (-) Transcript_24756:377-1336(-)
MKIANPVFVLKVLLALTTTFTNAFFNSERHLTVQRPGRSCIKNIEYVKAFQSYTTNDIGINANNKFHHKFKTVFSTSNAGADGSEKKLSRRSIPSFPKCVEDLAFEASSACLDMLQEQGFERIRVEIKGGKPGEGDDFDRTVGQFIALLGNCGYKQTRVIFGSVDQAVSARPFLRILRPDSKLVVDILDKASVSDKDELVLFVSPSNLEKWEALEKVQSLVCQAASNKTPMIMVNPRLRNYMRHAPLLLADFEHAFFFDRSFYKVDSFTSCGLLKRYPRKWEMFIVNLHQGGYIYFREFNEQPSRAQVVSAFQSIGKRT